MGDKRDRQNKTKILMARPKRTNYFQIHKSSQLEDSHQIKKYERDGNQGHPSNEPRTPLKNDMKMNKR
jgi:hypothetical protein